MCFFNQHLAIATLTIFRHRLHVAHIYGEARDTGDVSTESLILNGDLRWFSRMLGFLRNIVSAIRGY